MAILALSDEGAAWRISEGSGNINLEDVHERTVMFWLYRCAGTDTGIYWTLSKGNPAIVPIWYVGIQNPGDATLRIYTYQDFNTTPGAWRSDDISADIPQSGLVAPIHIAVTHDVEDADPIFYVNGVVVPTNVVGAPHSGTITTDNANPLLTGVGQEDPAGPALDTGDWIYSDMRFYNRILTETEIKSIANGQGRDRNIEGLLIRYPLWQLRRADVSDGQPYTYLAPNEGPVNDLAKGVASENGETNTMTLVNQLGTIRELVSSIEVSVADAANSGTEILNIIR